MRSCSSRQQQQQLQQAQRAGSSAAALLVAGGFLLGSPSLTPPAFAETAYEARQNVVEQRKALLNKAREDALKKASEVTPSPTEGAADSAKASVEESKADLSESVRSFTDDVQKKQAEAASKMESKDLAPSPAAPINEPRQPSPKAAAPKQEASKEAGKAPAFSFGAAKHPVEAAKESTKEAARSIPEPEPKKSPEPVPSLNFSSKPQGQTQREAPALKPKAAVQGEMPKSMSQMKADLKKQDASKGKKQKRRGPLPMTLAQLLILAFYGGLGYAVAVKDAEVRSVLQTAGRLIGQGYNKAVGSLPKQLKEKS